MVELTHISAYAGMFLVAESANPIGADQWPLILTGIVSAFVGVLLGKRYLHKITMRMVQNITGFMLLAIAILLMSGII